MPKEQIAAISRFLRVFLSSMVALSFSSCGGPNARDINDSESGNASQPPVKQGEIYAAPATQRGFGNLPEPYRSADYNLGRRTFKLCSACHTVVEGGQNLVGPNLHGVFERHAGSLAGYKYSKALETAGFAWTPERVSDWLASPNAYLPGNNMSFAGVRKPDERTAVIAYLMLESGYGRPASNDSSPAGTAN